ncbi:MAG: phosphatase PAP2 family protein [Cytophagales bacterium]|nr:phosphatase PAP2 family protein [Cytophaga sp.]
MKGILQHTRIFLSLFAIYIVLAGFFVFKNTKGTVEVWLNTYNNNTLDLFFFWATYLGDGIIAIGILLAIGLFLNLRKAFTITVILLLVSAVTQVLKHFVFYDVYRPSVFLKGVTGLHYVPGLEIHSGNSFPSGHTTQAFCLFFLFSFYIKNRNWQYVFFIIALLAGISRVYLLQHFLIDIYFGAIIGTLGSILFLYYFNKINLLNYASIDKPLINIRS